jgi:carboxymethylenebutenolidase
MTRTSVAVGTPDGSCPVHLFRPEAGGPWPVVLFYMDGLGIRPALFDMADRMARAGYYVMLPDLFYRTGPTEPDDGKNMLFGTDDTRRTWFSKHIAPLTVAKVMLDTAAFLDFLAGQPDVVQGKIGTTGYCMGGRFALAAAGTFPGRVVAAASYHGSRLVTDDPDSPHRLAPQMTARVYVAGAVEDAGFTDDMRQRLDDALTAAGVEHTVETYAGARHGWVPADTPVHDPVAAERHWQTLFALFDDALRP